LSDAGAKVVVFDLRFEAPSSFDGKLAESVRRAAGRGTSVVVGAASFKIESGVPLPRIAKDLADALPELKWGTLEGAAASRRVQIARPLEDALPDWLHAETVPVVPSLALRTVMEFKRGPSPGEELHAVLRLSDDTVLLRTKDGRTAASIPVVDRRLNVLVNVARGTELEQQPYHEVHSAIITSGALKAYAGKIVLVGYRTPDEIAWSVTRREKRWEMEVQASAISQVLQGRNIRRLRPAEQYAVVLLMGGVGWLLRTRFSAWMRPTLTLPLLKLSDKPLEVPVAFVVAVAAYFLAAFTLFKNAGLVLHFPYDVAALVLSYAVIGWAGRVPVASSRPELVAPRGRPAPQP
jgi:CHASE2 domain-containing sensor protein